MKKIPTAEEFCNEYLGFEQYGTDVPYFMIEFAKMHVEAALKEASEKARVQMGESYMREQITIHPHSLVDTVTITADSESILNSYSLDNIK